MALEYSIGNLNVIIGKVILWGPQILLRKSQQVLCLILETFNLHNSMRCTDDCERAVPSVGAVFIKRVLPSGEAAFLFPAFTT